MKMKSLLVAALLLVTMMVTMVTSCGDHQEVEPGQAVQLSDMPVGFGVGETSLRLADEIAVTRGVAFQPAWSTTKGSTMAVTAVHYPQDSETPIQMMGEQTVTCKEVTTTLPATYVWQYAPVVYWPKSGLMDFFAYAPATEARTEVSTLTPSHVNHQAMLMKCHVPASEITTIHTLGTSNGAVSAATPHDASKQHDLMFAFQRRLRCEDYASSVTSKVTMQFAHAMAGIKLDVTGLKDAMDDNGTPSDDSDDTPKVPAGTSKIVIGIGRLKTGGTLAICEPATAGETPDVVWTLDGLEGTFYETYTVTWASSPATITTIEREGGNEDDVFFFPPQVLEQGLTVTAYFYDQDNKRIGYRTLTLPKSELGELTRGTIKTLKIK